MRKVVPDSARRTVGEWCLQNLPEKQLHLYLKLLNGGTLEDLHIDSTNMVLYDYRNSVLRCPREGIGSLLEVFRDEVYDQYHSLRGGTVVDIGAYAGFWAVKASYWADRVIAFEPLNNLLCLSNTGGHSNIEVKALGLSNFCGHDSFYVHKNQASSSLVIRSKEFITIEVSALDAVIQGREVDFIKLDAEGAEPQVLEGARQTIEVWKPELAIATYKDYFAPTLEKVKQLGYPNIRTEAGLRRYIYAWY